MHNHSHDHSAVEVKNHIFIIGIVLNVLFIVIEFWYGIWSDSLSLISDAGHNTVDVLGLVLAWLASIVDKWKPTPNRTYGYGKVTVLASLVSSALLLLSIGVILGEAIDRLANPQEVNSKVVIIVAFVGVLINGLTTVLFIKGKKHDLNIRAAYLHMLSDTLISAGVVLSGVVILFTGVLWLDPVISMIIAAIIFKSTWSLLVSSSNYAIDAVPEGIDTNAIREFLLSMDEVIAIDDLHVWAMSSSKNALTVQLRVDLDKIDRGFVQYLSRQFHKNYSIQHSTIQVTN